MVLRFRRAKPCTVSHRNESHCAIHSAARRPQPKRASPCSPSLQSLNVALGREVHAAQEILEARVGAERVVPPVHLEPKQRDMAILIGFFQEPQSLLVLTET